MERPKPSLLSGVGGTAIWRYISYKTPIQRVHVVHVSTYIFSNPPPATTSVSPCPPVSRLFLCRGLRRADLHAIFPYVSYPQVCISLCVLSGGLHAPQTFTRFSYVPKPQIAILPATTSVSPQSAMNAARDSVRQSSFACLASADLVQTLVDLGWSSRRLPPSAAVARNAGRAPRRLPRATTSSTKWRAGPSSTASRARSTRTCPSAVRRLA